MLVHGAISTHFAAERVNQAVHRKQRRDLTHGVQGSVNDIQAVEIIKSINNVGNLRNLVRLVVEEISTRSGRPKASALIEKASWHVQ
jgi:hypothetical protein